jgi:acyl-homoserine lactone synthase
MMHLVTSENREIYRRELLEMHAHRKRVFVDELAWPLVCDGELEFDEFDTASAIYLLNLAPDGRLLASARLLRTDEPHLLDTVFPQLCGGAPPRGANIWEATRFCPSAEIQSPHQKRVLLGEIIAGILEAGLLFGVTDVTYVAGAALKPLALAAGWTVRPLGPSQRYERDRVTACVASIDAAGLRRVRELHDLKAPLLRYLPARRAA